MADLTPPADLVQLRRRFLAANKAWASAVDSDATRRAYEDAANLAEEIQDHVWWGTVENQFEARMALIAAANQAPA